MKKVLLTLILLFVFSPNITEATEVSFLNFCKYLEADSEELTKDEKAITISCVAFIKGVVETHSALVLQKEIKPQFCKPPKATHGQIGLKYLEYSRKTPPKSYQNEAEYLLQALKTIYPCK